MSEEVKKEATSKESTSAKAMADEGKKEVAVPTKFKSLVEEIEKMSVIDLAELVKILEEKFGVSAAAPAVAVAVAPGASAEDVPEKDSFDIEITEAGGTKIAVIKAIRTLTEMGLKEAKDLVDSAPKVVKEGVKKEDAEAAKKTLEEAGATVTLK